MIFARCDRCGREERIRLEGDGDWTPWVHEVGNDVWIQTWTDETTYCGRPCAPSDWGRPHGPRTAPPDLTNVSVAYESAYVKYVRERIPGAVPVLRDGIVDFKFTKEGQ